RPTERAATSEYADHLDDKEVRGALSIGHYRFGRAQAPRTAARGAGVPAGFDQRCHARSRRKRSDYLLEQRSDKHLWLHMAGSARQSDPQLVEDGTFRAAT